MSLCTIAKATTAATLAAGFLATTAPAAGAAPRDVWDSLILTTASGQTVAVPWNNTCTTMAGGGVAVIAADNHAWRAAILWRGPGCNDAGLPWT
ncbi:hypothetical protein ACWEPC_59250 [Nonomuraea sp. NPDC004297]